MTYRHHGSLLLCLALFCLGSHSASSSAGAIRTAPTPSVRLHMLAVGISEYQQEGLRLLFPAKDAQDIAALMRAQHKLLYQSVDVRVLTDQQATRRNILLGLEWLRHGTSEQDVAILFLAGHGLSSGATASYYFLPYEADPAAIDATMLPESAIRGMLSQISGRALLLLDTCHAGQPFAPGKEPLRVTPPGAQSHADSGVVVITASTAEQSAQEAPHLNNGVFTKSLLEGLGGRADFRKTGHVTVSMLELYINERVRELTHNRQTPTIIKPAALPDFTIAVPREIVNDDVAIAR